MFLMLLLLASCLLLHIQDQYIVIAFYGRCVCCREVAALGRSLAAVGGRLESLLVAAVSQGLQEQPLTSSSILSGPAPTLLSLCFRLHIVNALVSMTDWMCLTCGQGTCCVCKCGCFQSLHRWKLHVMSVLYSLLGIGCPGDQMQASRQGFSYVNGWTVF